MNKCYRIRITLLNVCFDLEYIENYNPLKLEVKQGYNAFRQRITVFLGKETSNLIIEDDHFEINLFAARHGTSFEIVLKTF